MKSFGTALCLAAVASAVNVGKANHNPAFAQPTQTYVAEPAHHQVHHDDAVYEQVDDQHHIEHHAEDFEDYYVTGDEYHTGNSYIVEQPVWEPAPRYWGDHLHYRGPTQVNFHEPAPFVAAPVEYETPRFLPYIPKYKNHYVNVEPKEVHNDFGSLFKPYDFYSPPEEDVYGDPIYDPKNDKLHGKPKKEEKAKDIHAHLSDHEEEHHSDHEEEHHDVHHDEHHDEGVHTIVRYDCDCSDVAAERDAAIVDRDQAQSELALYKLAFGDILPETAAPVYVHDTTESNTVSYEDQYEYSYYEPESFDHTQHDDIAYHHDPITTEYHPTDEELHYFDAEEYAPETYYRADAGTWGYFDHVLNSFDGHTDFSNHDFEESHAVPQARREPVQRAVRNHGHGH
jgi:hypothetical protein